MLDCHDNESWADLRVGEVGLMRGGLEVGACSPAPGASGFCLTLHDWSQVYFETPDDAPVTCKHLEGEMVNVTFRRTEDGMDAICIWVDGGVPVPFEFPDDEIATCVRCGNTDNDGSDVCPDCGDAMVDTPQLTTVSDNTRQGALT